MKKIISCLMIMVLAILITACGDGTNVIELGEPIEMDDSIYIVLNEGGTFDGAVYPSNAVDENTGIEYAGDGIMLAFYGEIKNLAATKIDVNKIVKVKFIVDDKYETSANIWLENADGTEFMGFDSADLVYLDPNAYLTPLDKANCVLMAKIGNGVHDLMVDGSDAIIELTIKDDLEDDSSEMIYELPFVLE